ncbi:gluconate 2-dehydrogenase subunit 3 family protein [Halorientalis halophila]|uniref:gluconate 2-dehydrogenase subunit 3 family protein n=1 Tax=Halorientalis halophila TaxID=3108499 RepID=UPI00300B22FC
MELTRRDALAALAGAGVVGASGAAVLRRDADGATGEPPAAETVETATAVAEVIYPAAVSNVPEFVETYLSGRLEARPEHRAGVEGAVAELDRFADAFYDVPRYVDLDADRRLTVLHRANVDENDPDPDGGPAERVRYYVVNDLLFALYASPTGGELVGIENPQGHPGGADSYQRGPK